MKKLLFDTFRKNKLFIYTALIVITACAAAVIMLLLENINVRKFEGRQHIFRVVEINENTIDPEIWGKNYPRQYDGYKRTVDTERTKHGGSEAFDKLKLDTHWVDIFSGYAFGVDYREDRGHAYMLSDQDATKRLKVAKQPGACLHCHSSVIPAYRAAGIKSGIPNEESYKQKQIMKGFETVCAMPYEEARKMVKYPVACVDCHNSDTMQLQITRPAFLNAIKVLSRSGKLLPHLPSVEKWRKDGSKGEYDVNKSATRQEMRSFVCAQCHVEYYFKGEGKLLVYPWQNGIKVEDLENYYDEAGHKDWVHKSSGAPVLKAQHPEFELWSMGIHARSGVACADCHMSYKREGAVKISDHHVQSPMLNISNTCRTCHHLSEAVLKERVETIQETTRSLELRAEDAVAALIGELKTAIGRGYSDESLKKARSLQRKAQWRLDFIAAENSMGFHAPQEAARILGEAIDYARLGQLEIANIRK